VNTSIEFKCLTRCTSNINWYYIVSPATPRVYNRSVMVSPCIKNKRCHVVDDKEMGQSVLSIDDVQFDDNGTYLCSAGTMNQPDYCEMSFNLTGTFLISLLCILFFLFIYFIDIFI